MELVILGLVVLFLYVFIRGLSDFSAWVGGSALSGPTATWRPTIMGGTRAAGSPTRRP